MPSQRLIGLSDGWSRVRNDGIKSLEMYLEAEADPTQEKPKELMVFTKRAYADLYTCVYNMCTQRTPHNWSEQLYGKYSEAIREYLVNHVVQPLVQKKGDALLSELAIRWNNHTIYIRWLERFFTYLDRYHVKLKSLQKLSLRGMSIFKAEVFDKISGEVIEAVLNCIERERRHERINQELIQTAVAMHTVLGDVQLELYNTVLEAPILEATEVHYRTVCSNWLRDHSFSEYLLRTEAALAEEEDRCCRYLSHSTWLKLQQLVNNALLAHPQSELLNKPTAVRFLLENQKLEDLSRMYKLYVQLEGRLEPIAASFKAHVAEKGLALVEERNRELQSAGAGGEGEDGRPRKPGEGKKVTAANELSDPRLIQSLLDLHDQYKKIAFECFKNDFVFQKALKEAFESVVSRDVGRYSCAALLASYCDRLLKKGSEHRSDEEIEDKLTKIVELFSFLSEKDLFADFYRTQLARRLLGETSASSDSEKSMIQKLKIKCGATFTSRLEGMVNDLHVAQDLQRKFVDFTNDRPTTTDNLGGIDFSVQVLSTGHWPTYQAHDVALPQEMRRCLQTFQSFYAEETSHRRLTWIQHLGTVTVAGVFDNNRRHDFICNGLQASLLLLFNSSKTLRIRECREALNLEDTLVKKLLGSFAFSRFRILVRTKRGGSGDKQLDDDDEFEVNEKFTCNHRKIRIPTPVQEEAPNRVKVEEDRSYAIEAAIVRIMKARKTLQHAQLIAEVLSLLQFFKPNPKDIKGRIEVLISRDYLSRDESSPQIYHYVA